MPVVRVLRVDVGQFIGDDLSADPAQLPGGQGGARRRQRPIGGQQFPGRCHLRDGHRRLPGDRRVGLEPRAFEAGQPLRRAHA